MSNGVNAPYGLIAVESVSGGGATRKMKDYRIAVADDGTTTVGPIFFGDPVKFQPVAVKVYTSGGQNVICALTPSNNTAASMVSGAILGTFIGCQYKLNGRTIERNYWPGGPVDAGSHVIAFVNDDPNTIFKVQMSTSDNGAVNTNLNASSSTIFQNWMIGQNALLQLGGVLISTATVTNPVIAGLPIPNPNPTGGNTNNGRSAVYLDGFSISLLAAGTTIASPNENYFQTLVGDTKINAVTNFSLLKLGGNPAFDVKIIGLAPSSSISMGLATTMDPYNKLTPGVSMPFCDVLVKFNNHVYGSLGTPGSAWSA